jgi:hypothetical protein
VASIVPAYFDSMRAPPAKQNRLGHILLPMVRFSNAFFIIPISWDDRRLWPGHESSLRIILINYIIIIIAWIKLK